MPRARTTLLTVMGILNIVVGSLFLLLYICAGIGLIFLFTAARDLPGLQVNPFPDMLEFIRREMPSYIPITVTLLILSFVLVILLIVAGIGLLNVKRWGRTLSLIYSVFTIVMQLGSVIYTLAVVNPAMQRWQADFARRMGGFGAAPSSGSDNVMSVIGAVIGMLYAIVLLIMMLLPAAGAAFGGSRSLSYEADQYGSDQDEYERRRRTGDDGWGA